MALPKNEWQLLLKQISLNDINIGDKLNLSSKINSIFLEFYFFKNLFFFFLDRLLEDNLIDLLKVLKNNTILKSLNLSSKLNIIF